MNASQTSTQKANLALSSPATNTALVAVMAAFIAVLAIVPPIPVGGLGVPITLQTLGVALAGLCLGPWRGALAVTLYIAAGLAGLPIFAGGNSGFGILARPSVGYLFSFILAAMVSGFVARWAVNTNRKKTAGWFFLGVVASRYLVILPLGIMGVMAVTGAPFSAAFVGDMPFWIGDAIKGLIAAVTAAAVHAAFPQLLRTRR